MNHSLIGYLRRFALLGGLISVTSGIAVAQDAYPSKSIRMVVPLAAGSAVDKAARVVTQEMSTILGQPIVIDNRPGASGIIGAEAVAKAEPDGYTLGGFNDSILTMVPNMHEKMPWDPIKDFTPISLAATVEWGLVVPSQSPWMSVADVIEGARAKPTELMYSSGGTGSPQHMAMALFASQAGLQMMHVPYKGATPGAIAVASNEVQVGFQGLGTVVGLIEGGRLRLLAVATPEKLPQFPQAPTVSDSGLPGFMFNSWFVIVGPKGLDPAVVKKVNDAAVKALQAPAVREQLSALGMTPRGSSSEELGEATRKSLAVYQQLIKDNNIQPE